MDTIPCPICRKPAYYEPPETVDIGIGEMPVGPGSWECETHGHIWTDLNGVEHIQYPEGR